MPAAAFGQDDEVVAESFGTEDEVVGSFGANDEVVTPLHREMAAAGVKMGTEGDQIRLPQASEEDRLHGFMLSQAAREMPTATPETGGERTERLIGYAEQIASDLASPMRYFARLADIPIDATLNRDRPELQGATERAVQIPGINLPRAGEAESAPGKAVAGTYNAVADLVASLSTPEALAMLPAGVSKPVLAGWASQMAAHAPEQFAEAVRLAREGKTQEAWRAGATGGGEALMAWMAARHATGAPRLPRPEGELARGELPDPDTIARNLAAPGTLRPQESRGNVAPTEAATRPPDMVQFDRLPVFNREGEVVDVKVVPRIREIVVEEGGPNRIVVPERGAVREAPEGGRFEPPATARELLLRNVPAPKVREEVRPDAIQEQSPVALPGREAPEGIPQVEEQVRSAQAPPETRRPAETIVPPTAPVAEVAKPAPEQFTLPEAVELNELRIVKQQRGKLGRLNQERLNELESKLESGKPKPGIVSGTSAEAWADRVIASDPRAKSRLTIDPLDAERMAAYLTKGVAILERGARKFSDWSRRMIAEHGDVVRPHLRTLFEQATRTMATLEADGRKMRSVSRRGTASEQLPAEARERLTTDPASFYAVQRPRTIEDAVALMSNIELRQPLDVRQQGNQQNWVARQLELSRRLMADPPTRAEGYALFQQLAEAGTSFGQLVNQFKMLRNATPDGLLEIVNRRLAEQNGKPLTPEQRLQLRVLGGRNIADVAGWRRAEEAWASNPTPANVKAVAEAKAAAEESGRRFNERVQRIVPRGFWDTLTAMSMGGKLSMISQERNVVANLALMPWRAISRLPAAAIDMLDSMVRNKPRQVALVPGSVLSGAGASALQSAPKAWRVLTRGDAATGIGKADTHVNLRPLVALREIIAGALTGDKSLAQKLTLMAEASPPGYFAAGMLRGLGGLDIPSREAARGRLIAEAIKLDQLKNERMAKELARRPRTPEEEAELQLLRRQPRVDNALIRQAVMVPELFLKPEVLDRVNREALGAVFQDPNLFTRWFLRDERLLPGPVRFLLRNVIPFISLPVNWAGKLLGWSPAGFATHVARHALNGDGRAAKLAAGEAIIGSMAWYAASYLIAKGLLSPPLDSENEQQKMRLLSGDIMPPNHINVSGLQRLFKGEDPAWRPGDNTKDFTYYGSVVGAQMQMVAASLRQMEKQPAPENQTAWWESFLWNATQGAGGYLVNQTFMQGARDLLDAMKSDRKMETWLAGYVGAVLDTAAPRQLEAINRSVSKYAREVKDDALDRRLNNVLVQRFGLFTAAEDKLPFKRDVWGRPLRATPEGANPWIYQLFDVGKSRTIPDDPIKLEIYNLARRTGDMRAIPTPPDASLIIRGKTYQLDAHQKSRLEELVGQQRETLAHRVINARFLMARDPVKLAILERVWAMGNARGQALFYRENGSSLTEKRSAAGFQPK